MTRLARWSAAALALAILFLPTFPLLAALLPA